MQKGGEGVCERARRSNILGEEIATISYKSEQAVHLRDFERSNARVAHERRHRSKVWERK